MFSLGNSNPLRGLQKRISSFASTIFAGPTPIKLLKAALEAGDEAKAIEIYTQNPIDPKTNIAGPSLMEELNPSLPFPSKKSLSFTSSQSPLHLAAKQAMYRIFTMFLEHGGNPNSHNGKDETCLHCVCSGSDNPLVRREIMEMMLRWEGMNGEVVSINHADIDGNIALHYAASNGLTECVQKLVELNSIMSLVNKSQMTCCEMADENMHKDIASMLEVAILFQPNDTGLPDEPSPSSESSLTRRKGSLILDTKSINISELQLYTERIIDKVYTQLVLLTDEKTQAKGMMISRERVEVILNAYSWDVNRIIAEYTLNPSQVFATSKLDKVPTSGADSSATIQSGNVYCAICSDRMSHVLTQEDISIARNDPTSLFDDRRSLMCPMKHQYCLDCWRSHLQVQIKDNGGYCLSCPGFKCQEIVQGGNQWVDLLFFEDSQSSSNTVKTRYYEQRARHVVDCCSSSMKWCPIPDCGAIIHFEHPSQVNLSPSVPSITATTETHSQLPTSLMCYNCHTFCTSCGADSHTPCSCEDWKKWQQKVQQEMQVVTAGGNMDDVANALWMAANTKRCPRCTSPIEKDEGCNHMSCRKCRHEFCWICMQDWSLHSNATGGFFQCNRYVSELASQNAAAGGDESNRALLNAATEELGNAHLETIRMKDRGNKMARFIPLYTRLKAHTDSVTMERRIFPETMTRMVKSLEESSPKYNSPQKLLWLQKTRVSHPYENEYQDEYDEDFPSHYPKALIPLQQGFEELIKCRMFLIGCVAYSYSVFAATDDDSMETLMRALSRNHHKYHSSMRLDDHKLSFERIQNDLEMYCEMLSDVVARRRLRAATSQITAIMTLVRQKRLELEELITMFQLQESKEKPAESSRGGSTLRHRTNRSSSQDHGYSRSGRDSRRSSTDGNDIMSRIAIGPNGIIFLHEDRHTSNDDDDDLDISSLAILIQEMENQLQLQQEPPPPPPPPASTTTGRSRDQGQQGINVAEMNDSDILQLLQPDAYSARSPSPPLVTGTVVPQVATANSSPSPSGGTSRRLGWFRSRNSSSSTSTTPARTSQRRISQGNEHGTSNDVSTGVPATIVQLSSTRSDAREAISSNSDSDDLDIFSPITPSRTVNSSMPPDRESGQLSRRAEEEAALNRAILMSLSDINQPNSRSYSTGSHQSSESVLDSGVANQENISTLVGMGFARNEAIQALNRTNNDIDAALNALLG